MSRVFSSSATKSQDLAKSRFLIYALIAGTFALGLLAFPYLRIYSLSPNAVSIFIAIATSLLATLIMQILYTRIAQEKIIEDIAEESAKTAIAHARTVMLEHFSRVVPKKTYPRSSRPTEEFRVDFANQLRSSSSYRHKGDAASFAGFRLTKLAAHPAVGSKEEVTLCILDPTAERQLRAHAIQELRLTGSDFTRTDVDQKTTEIRDKIFITLTALYDICHARTVDVYLHRENLFFRSEFFDEEVFISYYLGGEYPGAYLFSRGTYIYEAFSMNLKQALATTEYKIIFDDSLDEEKFKAHLRQLQCPHSIEILRARREALYAQYESELTFRPQDVF